MALCGKHWMVAAPAEAAWAQWSNEANARLMAAAPELLSALQAIVARQDAVDPEGLFRGLDDIKARAAIAKATEASE